MSLSIILLAKFFEWLATDACTSGVRRWLYWRRVCCYCNRSIGGNPFSKNLTHGCCKPCKKEQLEKCLSQRLTDERDLVVEWYVIEEDGTIRIERPPF